MTRCKTGRNVLWFIVALIVIRMGEYILDALFGEQIGYLSNPVIAFGLWCLYGSLYFAILIAILSGIRQAIISRYPNLSSLQFPSPTISQKAVGIGMFLLIFIAIGMNVTLCVNNPNFGADAYSYYFPVSNFFDGNGYSIGERTSELPPGYGLLIHLFFLVVRDVEFSAMLISSCAYILSLLVAYKAGKLVAGRLAGCLAAFFIAFCPMIVEYSFTSLITVCFFFFSLLGLFLYLNTVLRPPAYSRSLLLGLVLGYTLLIKEQGFVLAIAMICLLFIFTLIEQLKHRKQAVKSSFRKSMSYPASTLAILVIFLGIQMYSTYSATGSWTIYPRLYYYMRSHRSISSHSTSDVPPPTSSQTLTQKTPSSDAAGQEIASSSKQSVRRVLQKKRTASRLDFIPPFLSSLFSNVRMACGHLGHILAHAFAPGIFVVWLFGGTILMQRGRRNAFPLPHKVKMRHIHLCAAFFLFLIPFGVPIALGFADSPRHILENSAFFLVFAALIQVKLLRIISKKYLMYGMLAVCIISLLTTLGRFNESRLFNNRFLSHTFSLTSNASHQLWEEGIPYKAVRRLNRTLTSLTFGMADGLLDSLEYYAERRYGGIYYPTLKNLTYQLSYQTDDIARTISEDGDIADLDEQKTTRYREFYSARDFLHAVEPYMGKEDTRRFRNRLLTYARVSPLHAYTTFPDVLRSRGALQILRAEGFWLKHSYSGDIEHISIMARRGPVVLFYAGEKGRREPQGMAFGLPESLRPIDIVNMMTQERIEYLFLDQNTVVRTPHLIPLWENADFVHEIGLKSIYQDPQALFQVYALQESEKL